MLLARLLFLAENLTKVLHCESSVGGHIDKEDHPPRVLLERDVLITVYGESPIVVDCSCFRVVAVHLEGNKRDST